MFLILNLDQSTGKLQQCEAKLGYRTCFTKLDLSKWLQYISLNWFKNGLDKIPSLDSFIQMIEGHLLSNSWSRGTSSHSGLFDQAARLPCGVREPCKLKKIFYFLSSHLLPQIMQSCFLEKLCVPYGVREPCELKKRLFFLPFSHLLPQIM